MRAVLEDSGRLVVGLNIEYKGTKEARVMAWRPEIVTDEEGKRILISEQTVSEVSGFLT